MAIYRNVRISFWTDTKVVDDFTPEDRYFCLYLFTNPHTNLAGCYELSLKQASIELGYDVTAIKTLLRRFDEVHGLIKYSKKTKEVLILNWHKYNWTTSEKFRKPLLAEIEQIKEDRFKEYLKGVFNGVDTVSIPYSYGSDTTDTVTDTVTDTISVTDTVLNKPKVTKHIRNVIPPTLEMVTDYINENGYNVDAEAFMDYYESKGWLVGKNKMKDWQASVRNWSRNDYGKKSTNPFAEMLKKGDF